MSSKFCKPLTLCLILLHQPCDLLHYNNDAIINVEMINAQYKMIINVDQAPSRDTIGLFNIIPHCPVFRTNTLSQFP